MTIRIRLAGQQDPAPGTAVLRVPAPERAERQGLTPGTAVLRVPAPERAERLVRARVAPEAQAPKRAPAVPETAEPRVPTRAQVVTIPVALARLVWAVPGAPERIRAGRHARAQTSSKTTRRGPTRSR